jgi:hypothetical protein
VVSDSPTVETVAAFIAVVAAKYKRKPGYVVQLLNRPFRVAPERVRKSHFRSFVVQCNTSAPSHCGMRA